MAVIRGNMETGNGNVSRKLLWYATNSQFEW